MNQPVVLVTGGAGYIGSHTIIELIENGYEVISVDNYSNSTVETYNRIEDITSKKVKHYAIDLCDTEKSKVIFEENPGIIGIIHFAALKSVPESVSEPLMYYRNNIGSLLTILELAGNFNVGSIIFSSSCSVYGNVARLPVNEETSLGETASPYAFSKLAGERMLKDFIQSHVGFKACSLRYFNPVGAHHTGRNGELPQNRPNNLVPIITQVAIGKLNELKVFGNDYPTRDGTCIRDYIHVSDIADAHVKALDYLINTPTSPSYSLFNLGSGTGVTVLEAIAAFEQITGRMLHYSISERRPGDVAAIYSDSRKANELLGWKPTQTIASMMDSAWKWELFWNSQQA